MDDETRESHDSYGMIGLYRTSGDPGPLFGSSIRHQNYMTLRVRRAVKETRSAGYYTFAKEPLVEVMLSTTQFADLVTCVGHGDGLPCTIRSVGRQVMPPCPDYDQRAQFEADFAASARAATQKLNGLINDVRAVFDKPNVTKADRANVMGVLESIRLELADTQPFIQSQFNEAMDRTVTEAKGEVEAFVQHKVVSLGLEALRDQAGSRQLDVVDAALIPDAVRSSEPK